MRRLLPMVARVKPILLSVIMPIPLLAAVVRKGLFRQRIKQMMQPALLLLAIILMLVVAVL